MPIKQPTELLSEPLCSMLSGAEAQMEVHSCRHWLEKAVISPLSSWTWRLHGQWDSCLGSQRRRRASCHKAAMRSYTQRYAARLVYRLGLDPFMCAVTVNTVACQPLQSGDCCLPAWIFHCVRKGQSAYTCCLSCRSEIVCLHTGERTSPGGK